MNHRLHCIRLKYEPFSRKISALAKFIQYGGAN
jgi:hypothetical protein